MGRFGVREVNMHARRCAYCHDAGGEPACRGCGVVLHEECRKELSRCPTLGCVGWDEKKAAGVETVVRFPVAGAGEVRWSWRDGVVYQQVTTATDGTMHRITNEVEEARLRLELDLSGSDFTWETLVRVLVAAAAAFAAWLVTR